MVKRDFVTVRWRSVPFGMWLVVVIDVDTYISMRNPVASVFYVSYTAWFENLGRERTFRLVLPRSGVQVFLDAMSLKDREVIGHGLVRIEFMKTWRGKLRIRSMCPYRV